mmetsp:Transcript_18050/g.56635  ORF Transcript_18050/g.56635 Transcript_18050/m.56635 type:complete len:165 (-) Transcript_18050:59-553(-)
MLTPTSNSNARACPDLGPHGPHASGNSSATTARAAASNFKSSRAIATRSAHVKHRVRQSPFLDPPSAGDSPSAHATRCHTSVQPSSETAPRTDNIATSAPTISRMDHHSMLQRLNPSHGVARAFADDDISLRADAAIRAFQTDALGLQLPLAKSSDPCCLPARP